jgi:hypothetical protein
MKRARARKVGNSEKVVLQLQLVQMLYPQTLPEQLLLQMY